MKRPRGLRILMLYWHPDPRQLRSAVRQHLRALEASPYRHEILYRNAFEPIPTWIRHLNFDAVVLHTTFLCMRWSHLFPFWKWNLRWIAELKCPKVAFPQDEYDHSEVLDEWLLEWGVDTIFSNFDEPMRETLYPLMSKQAHFRKAFTGYIDDKAAKRYAQTLMPTGSRELDIVYRATHLPYWFGSHGQLKHRLADVVGRAARRSGLKIDISTRDVDTIVGNRWFEFLASGKAVLGCESGSSVLDRRGEVRAAIQYLLREDPTLTFEQVDARMPAGWDDHAFFAISPRHLEAVITRTCQVLVEGRYDGVLEGGRHYIPLRRDLSNVKQALERIANPEELEAIAMNAYTDIYLAGRCTYRDLALELDGALTVKGHGRAVALSGTLAGLATMRGLKYVRDDDTPDLVDRSIKAPLLRLVERRGRKKLSGAIGPKRVTLRAWSFRHPDRFRIALRALASDPVLRRLASRYLRTGTVRKEVGFGQLLEELLILRLLRETRSGKQSAGELFRWDPVYDHDRNQLTLLSRRPSDASVPWRTDTVRTALEATPSIVIDHSAIGRHLHHAVSSKRWVSIPVGPDRLRLKGVELLAKVDPAPALEALSAPIQAPGMLRRLRSDPLIYAAKGFLALRLILERPTLRRIWAAYLGRPGLVRMISLDQMVEDLLKLSIAEDQHLDWRYQPESQTLIMTTVLPDGANNSHAQIGQIGSVKHLVWDNSVLGPHMLVPVAIGKRLDVFVGQQAMHEFAALEAMMLVAPQSVRRALGLPSGPLGTHIE